MTDVDAIEQDNADEILTDDAQESAGDTNKRAARNAADRARRATRGRAPRGARPPKAPRTAGDRAATKEQVQALHQTVTLVGMALVSTMPAQLQPTADEYGNMVEPLERITLRHMPAAGALNPDARDAGMFALALCWYMMRLYRSGAFAAATWKKQQAAGPPPAPGDRPRTAPQQAGDMARQAAGPSTQPDDPLAAAFRATSNVSEAELAAFVGS